MISVLAVFAMLAVPAGSSRVQEKAYQVKALSNAKQIALACKLFATDHGGSFPSNLLDSTGAITSTPPTSSNAALAQLIPDYIPDEKIFWLPRDTTYCNPSEPDGNAPWLGAGENHWGYVTNLSEKSRPEFPLIADGTAPGTTKYSSRKTLPGGTWEGKKAIVVCVDGSGRIERINQRTMTIPGPTPEIADLLQSGQKNWLAPENQFLNPVPKP